MQPQWAATGRFGFGGCEQTDIWECGAEGQEVVEGVQERRPGKEGKAQQAGLLIQRLASTLSRKTNVLFWHQ